ncbi:hypothetical protein A4S05_00255 [Nostoc sp. KVJ20]|nr:hypothetical protein A4S05_00255 [Nostoc sp. KVJ20]
MSVIDPLRLEVQSCEVSYTLQVNLHLFFMTLLTAFRQLYVTDITLNEAILLEVQFRVGLNPLVKRSHQICNFVSQTTR